MKNKASRKVISLAKIAILAVLVNLLVLSHALGKEYVYVSDISENEAGNFAVEFISRFENITDENLAIKTTFKLNDLNNAQIGYVVELTYNNVDYGYVALDFTADNYAFCFSVGQNAPGLIEGIINNNEKLIDKLFDTIYYVDGNLFGVYYDDEIYAADGNQYHLVENTTEDPKYKYHNVLFSSSTYGAVTSSKMIKQYNATKSMISEKEVENNTGMCMHVQLLR